MIDQTTMELDEAVGEEQAGSGQAGYSYVPDASEMQIPRLRLAQMLTPDVVDGDARGGQWLVPGEGAVDTVAVTVLGMKKTRLRSTRDEDNRMVVLCQADSAVSNPLRGVGDPGVACDTCQFSQWGEDESGRRRPPGCTVVWRYLVQSDGGNVADLSLSEKSANQAAKQINALYAQVGARPGVLEVELASDLVTKGGRRYYVPVIARSGMAGGFTRLGASPPQRALAAEAAPIELREARRPAGDDDEEEGDVPFDGPPIEVHGLTPVEVKRKTPTSKEPARQEATPRQIKYLHAVAREVGLTADELQERSQDTFGVGLEELSRRDVSALIEQLQAERDTTSVAN